MVFSLQSRSKICIKFLIEQIKVSIAGVFGSDREHCTLDESSSNCLSTGRPQTGRRFRNPTSPDGGDEKPRLMEFVKVKNHQRSVDEVVPPRASVACEDPRCRPSESAVWRQKEDDRLSFSGGSEGPTLSPRSKTRFRFTWKNILRSQKLWSEPSPMRRMDEAF